jgi:hypothetical protein
VRSIAGIIAMHAERESRARNVGAPDGRDKTIEARSCVQAERGLSFAA